jgi:D-3-phosphoglycerate dehydrogenase
MPYKILSIDSTNSILQENIIKAGFDFSYFPSYEREDLLQQIHNYDCLIVRSKILIDKEIIDKGVRLRCIARVGSGMDAIDTQYAQKKGIICLNSPEGNRDAVGEHAVGLLLSLFNKINFADHEVRDGLWQREANRGLEIKGKTIGIIGYGNMGQAFAQRLSGFDATVLAYDKYKIDYGNMCASAVDLETIFEQTDVLSLHVPLTQETEFMVNNSFISNFKKPFYLLNTSRGKVVKLSELVLAMQSRKILGAALDVLEYEAFSNELCEQKDMPLELKKLFLLKNTVFTPHVAGWTLESDYKLADILSQKIIATLS